ncbi:uncharacterized protein PV06_10418 [Exophiala oligosperma]|uniref:alpha-1,2-Mannosidase n=1 Tax=Exophiala oligosperma TaxID=215243 RepID=A0A0D2DNK1_9EURO|nr:uncharacterized protein PV06_10418 [Exophiala oligosperma]KIW37374.1 hypothetical protein PV06_10418 [Exophiala oligosperma]
MFRLRRYRVFLVVAVLSILTIYQLSRVNHWDGTTLEGLIGHKPEIDQTTVPDSQRPPNRVQPEPDKPAAPAETTPPPPAAVSTEAAPTPVPEVAVSSSTSPQDSSPTVTGEESLAKQPDFDEEFGEHGQGRYEVKNRPPGIGRAVWRPQPAQFPISSESLISLPQGQPQTLPKIQHNFGWEAPYVKADRKRKQTRIREAFKHAWNGYKNHSMGHDELKPISKKSADPFNGWGATLVDTLDTLWMMDLRDEFEDAVAAVSQINFKSSARKDIPLFETTIRYLGGLIAAYDISDAKYPILLEKALQLADILLGAFDTPNHMPIGYYNWAPSYASQPHRAGAHTVMAELGSLAMEFTRLAQITKKPKYYDAIARVTNALEKWQMETEIPGLWPLKLDASGCKKPDVVRTAGVEGLSIPFLAGEIGEGEEPAVNPFSTKPQADSGSKLEKTKTLYRRAADDSPESEKQPGKVDFKPTLDKPVAISNQDWEEDYASVDCAAQELDYEPHSTKHTYGIGAMADSTYEYFPKMFALLGGLNTQYKSMYMDAMDAVRRELLFRPMTKENHDILFAAKQIISPKAVNPSDKKVTIYEGSHLGCFAGGMFALGAKLFGISGDMTLATKLTDGCVWSYASTPVGVMPEEFELVPCDGLASCSWDETKWREALDPHRKERFRAVEEYNLNQQKLREEAMQGLEDGAVEPISDPSMKKKRDELSKLDDTEPSRTIVTDDAATEEEGEEAGIPPPPFVPRVPLSHEKYVAARLLEERLPPGYTKIGARDYRLRPEAIESVFIMYRVTGDESWREKGWTMFDAVERATKTDVAHAAIKDVTSQLGEQSDSMESFWLAETLKYYYLLFSEPELVSLDDYVLNTEAHPFKRPGSH